MVLHHFLGLALFIIVDNRRPPLMEPLQACLQLLYVLVQQLILSHLKAALLLVLLDDSDEVVDSGLHLHHLLDIHSLDVCHLIRLHRDLQIQLLDDILECLLLIDQLLLTHLGPSGFIFQTDQLEIQILPEFEVLGVHLVLDLVDEVVLNPFLLTVVLDYLVLVLDVFFQLLYCVLHHATCLFLEHYFDLVSLGHEQVVQSHYFSLQCVDPRHLVVALVLRPCQFVQELSVR